LLKSIPIPLFSSKFLQLFLSSLSILYSFCIFNPYLCYQCSIWDTKYDITHKTFNRQNI